MDLDETSLAIGRLQALQQSTAGDVKELKARAESMDLKLDRLLARSERTRFTLKYLGILLLGSSAAGGGIAQALRKLFE